MEKIPLQRLAIIMLLATSLTSCKVTQYETREYNNPDATMLSNFLGDRTQVIVHQGDLQYRFDSASIMGTSLTGHLYPPESGKTNYPEPDTTVGIHPWTEKKRAPWMKACHIYVHDSVSMPMGFIYLWPDEIRIVRDYTPIEQKGEGAKIGEDIALGLLKAILLMPFAFLGNHSGSDHTSYSSSGTNQPRGQTKSTQNAKVRSFPRKDNHF